MQRILFEAIRTMLVAATGHGYDRAPWLNNLHHKFAYRLHKALPFFGITGVQRVPVPNLPGRFMYVHAEDGGVAHQLIMYHQYEPFESKLVCEYLKAGMTLYNIGANLGYYTLLASERVGPKGNVYAFEPESRNLELLRRTISENGCTNVQIQSMAVSAEAGVAALSLSETNSGDHRLAAISTREQVEVEVTSIDTFIAEGHAVPDVIIMDVQGAELDVLRGAESLLNSNTALLLFTEFWPEGLDERHPNGAREMLETLKHAGFELHQIDELQRRLIPTTRNKLIDTVHDDKEVNLLCMR